MNDLEIYFGDAVKALDDNGRVGGYLVRFSDSSHKDLDGDYFPADGYYGPKDGDGAEALFDHGMPVKSGLEHFADRTFQPLKTKKDDIGIFAETVLDMEDEYEKFIFSRVKKGRIGWSSGAPGHRVKREKDGRLARWPIAEGSLTPRPAEPLNRAMPIKSFKSVAFVSLEDEGEGETKTCETCNDNFIKGLQDYKCEAHKATAIIKSNSLASVLTRHIEDRVDSGNDKETIIKSLARESGLDTEQIEGILSGEVNASVPNLKAFARVLEVSFDSLRSAKQRDYSRTIKGMFEEALVDQTPSRWQLDSVYSDIIRKLAQTAQASNITGVKFDLEAKVKEATGEYMERLQSLAVAQINEYVESGNDEPFYLKAIIDLSEPLPVSGSLDLESHSLLAVSALKGVVARYRANHEARQREGNNQKAGRVLSQANRSRLSKMLEQIKGAVEDCQTLLDESQPMATEAEKRAVVSQQLRLEQKALELASPFI